MGYSKAPEQPQSSARPICHSHAMTRMGREPTTIRIAAFELAALRTAPRETTCEQTDRQTDSLYKADKSNTLLFSPFQKYPSMWQGQLVLKNDSASVNMLFVHGNKELVGVTLPPRPPQPPSPATPPVGETEPLLRISQRMRLETQQVEGVAKRMEVCTDIFTQGRLVCSGQNGIKCAH